MLSISIIFVLVITFIYTFYVERSVEKFRKATLSLLALNISHLHDASNLFALIKTKSNSETSIFAKGAAYHFRSLFEEMKTSYTTLVKNPSGNNWIQLFYQKEILNLKDILESELFTLSSTNIDWRDYTGEENLWIEANFSLLSKAFLNIVENSLKYNSTKIKIEIFDLQSRWQVVFTSYGISIPDTITNSINASYNFHSGHGLESIIDIINYHNADINIQNLLNHGSCIKIAFGKKSQNTKTKTTPITKATNSHHLKNKLLLSLSVLSIILSIILTTSTRKKEFKTQSLSLPKTKVQDQKLKATQNKAQFNPIEVNQKSNPRPLEANISTIDHLIAKQDQELGLDELEF